jgi:hypothetical protein
MKVDQQTLMYIQNVVETARLVKIENIIIEPGKVRAMDEDRSVVLFQDSNVPDLPFNAIGLARIDVFQSRFEIAKSISGFEIEAVMNNDKDFARALVMKGKGIKIDYKCASPKTIQAPKTLNDTIKYQIAMTPDAVQLMSKGVGAMGADEITFVGGADGVSFEIEDINRDMLSFQFATSVIEVEGGQVGNFKYKYPIKHILSLFKHNSSGSFFISTHGMMKIQVNGLDMHIPPRG